MRERGIDRRFVILWAVAFLIAAGPVWAAWSDVSSDVVDPYGVTAGGLEEISDGYADGTWRPYEPMARRHFAKMAVERYGLLDGPVSGQRFPDVPPDYPLYVHIESAARAGLVQGFADGLFHPGSLMTREQAAALIARHAARLLGSTPEELYPQPAVEAVLAPFADAELVSADLLDEIAFAVDRGILRGTGRGLEPRIRLTRIQGAALLLRSGTRDPPSTTTTAAAGPAPLPAPSTFLASLYFDTQERFFPLMNSGPAEASPQQKLFNSVQDGNGDGRVDVEDAVQNVVPYAIGSSVTGVSRSGLVGRGPNDQRPAVYFNRVDLDGTYAGWTVYQYWLYYADNPPGHEHDWEAYFVYLDPSREPRFVRLSRHASYPSYSWSSLASAGRLYGTHPLLSVNEGSHAFESPEAVLNAGVRIGWDGTVDARAGRLDDGDGGSFPWRILSSEPVSGVEGFTSEPDVYYYGDPVYLLNSGEWSDAREAPWRRAEWLSPLPPR